MFENDHYSGKCIAEYQALNIMKISVSKDIPILLISGMSPGRDLKTDDFIKLLDDDSISLPDGLIERPVQLPESLELVESLLK